MKYLFPIFLILSYASAYAQIDISPSKAPKGLILYPQIYQIITVEPVQDFQPSLLHSLDYNLTVIDRDDTLEIFIEHDHYSTYQRTKESILNNLKNALNNSAAIINIQSYGREYLPSHYWKYASSSKTTLKAHPNRF